MIVDALDMPTLMELMNSQGVVELLSMKWKVFGSMVLVIRDVVIGSGRNDVCHNRCQNHDPKYNDKCVGDFEFFLVGVHVLFFTCLFP